MLADVDETLRNLLASSTLAGESVRVDLDAPNRDWSGRRSVPTLNLFLADIRENLDMRRSDPQEITNADGQVTARQARPRYYALTYVLTAWAGTPEDEHRLLGAALVALLRHDYLPADICRGMLAELSRSGFAVRLRVGGTLFTERMATELWSALGTDYRPSLSVTVHTPVPTGVPIPAGPPQTQPPAFAINGTQTSAVHEDFRGPMPTAGAAAREGSSVAADDGSTASALPAVGSSYRTRTRPSADPGR